MQVRFFEPQKSQGFGHAGRLLYLDRSDGRGTCIFTFRFFKYESGGQVAFIGTIFSAHHAFPKILDMVQKSSTGLRPEVRGNM
jgi:hypothetical protein